MTLKIQLDDELDTSAMDDLENPDDNNVDDDNTTDTVEDKDNDKDTSRNPDLESVQKENEQYKAVLQAINNDPLLAEAIRRRAAGKEFKLIDPEELEKQKSQNNNQQSDPEPDPDWDELSNQELVQKFESRIVSTLEDRLNKVLGTVEEKLSPVSDFIQQSQTEKVKGSIENARSKYKDFDNYRSDMLALSKNHPTLGPEELYLLAKSQKGGWVSETERRGTQSERPNTSTTPNSREKTKKERKAEDFRGRSGFSSLLQDALKDVNITEL